jgi:hypothetical protein
MSRISSNFLMLLTQINQLIVSAKIERTKEELERLSSLLSTSGIKSDQLSEADFQTGTAQHYRDRAKVILDCESSEVFHSGDKVTRYAVLAHVEGPKGISPNYQLNGRQIFNNKVEAESFAVLNSSDQMKLFVMPLNVCDKDLPNIHKLSLRCLGINSLVLQQLLNEQSANCKEFA